MKKLITSLKVFFVFAFLLGIAYPLSVLSIGKIFFPDKTNGSLIKHKGEIIGSSLIGQKFNSPKYFHGRFSAVDYNASASGGSNLAASSKVLHKQTKKHLRIVKTKNNIKRNSNIPPDAILTSASGLDPHISLKNALLQLPRIIRNRKPSRKEIRRLIRDNTDPDFIGIWGKAGVNVLKLNLALDKLEKNI